MILYDLKYKNGSHLSDSQVLATEIEQVHGRHGIHSRLGIVVLDESVTSENKKQKTKNSLK